MGFLKLTKPKSAGYYRIARLAQAVEDGQDKGALTVFFLARSPEAPRTTIVVFSFNSMVLDIAMVSELFPTEPKH